jgi:hypothetical protein
MLPNKLEDSFAPKGLGFSEYIDESKLTLNFTNEII